MHFRLRPPPDNIFARQRIVCHVPHLALSLPRRRSASRPPLSLAASVGVSLGLLLRCRISGACGLIPHHEAASIDCTTALLPYFYVAAVPRSLAHLPLLLALDTAPWLPGNPSLSLPTFALAITAEAAYIAGR